MSRVVKIVNNRWEELARECLVQSLFLPGTATPPCIARPMKNNATTLQKVERILNESEYKLRYERGTFQSGYCILEQKKVVVLNKFLDTEARINTLSELIPQLEINFDKLTQESQKLYSEMKTPAIPHTPGDSN